MNEKINTLNGKLSVLNDLKGSLTIPEVISDGHDIYDGNCIVTPCIEGETINCKNKVMPNDVVVEPIPYYEVSNEKNGSTIIIGKGE